MSFSETQPFIAEIILPGHAMKTINVVPKKPVKVTVYKENSQEAVNSQAIERVQRYQAIRGANVHISIQRSGRKMMLTNEGTTACWIRITQVP